MFVPLKDNNPLILITIPFVNWGLIAINVVVFVFFQSELFSGAGADASLSFGIIPSVLFNSSQLSPSFAVIPSEFTLVTYMFLHGGWLHLLANMLFLWVLGDNIEDAIGHFGYLVFYLLCGVAAALFHAWILPDNNAPLIGASGAVSGVIGAYLLLHPRVKIWILILWRIPLPIPAVIAFGIWIILQVVYAATSAQGNVAWWAHIGGFAAGCVLIVFMRRKSFPLFGLN